MENVILHEYRIPIDGIKQKTIYHISDLHLNEYDALSDTSEISTAKEKEAFWENLRQEFSLSHGESYGEPQKATAATHFKNLVDIASDGDALIFTGDIFDSISGANIRLAEKILAPFPRPIFAVCGNHEDAAKMPRNSAFGRIYDDIQTLDLGDIKIIGINNSNRIVTKEQCDAVKKSLDCGKPTIIAMHIPFMTRDTRDVFMGIGDGYRINYDGCPSENRELLNIIKENPKNCIAVIAGHIHFALSGSITDDVPQFIASQAITGHINKYIIGK